MMNWYGNGMNGWGYGLMTVSMLLFWALVIAAVVVLVRHLDSQRRQTSTAQPAKCTPEQVLAERFAHGDIDDDEYRHRVGVLRSHVNS
ncbi:MAG: putative rane protein [Micromonosporaceae bacterium]|jgi:putative membrane protein|nr:putative rane protein [Micromonosporaceae bacterium]MDT5037399.1 putative rane protein [Micromonosporaceae bacterium]